MLAILLLGACGIAAERIEIPFQFENGLIWVDVAAKGKKLKFVVDSGAGATVLHFDTVRKLRLKVGEARPLYGAGMQGVAYRVTDFEGSVGGVPLSRDAFAVPLRKVKGRGWKFRKMDGMIGQDFFRERIVEIDYPNRRLTLLAEGRGGRGAVRLPIRREKDAMCVPVGVDGSEPRWVRLDTGCVSDLEWVVPGAAGRREREAVVRLGSLRHEGVRIGSHGSPLFPNEAGLLGNGLLSHYRVTIDGRAMQLFLEKPLR